MHRWEFGRFFPNNFLILVVHITSEGKTRYPRLDVSTLFQEFANEIGRDIAYEPKNDH